MFQVKDSNKKEKTENDYPIQIPKNSGIKQPSVFCSRSEGLLYFVSILLQAESTGILQIFLDFNGVIHKTENQGKHWMMS